MSTTIPVALDSIIFGLQHVGGISNYWARLIQHVKVNSDFNTSLILPRNLKYRDFDPLWLESMSIYRDVLPERISRYLPADWGSERGIFHTSYYRIPRKKVYKYIVTVYDFTYERYSSGLVRLIHTQQKMASLRKADLILCISESTRQDLIEFCPDVDPAKLHVIHLGVDLTCYYPELCINSDLNKEVVLYVGQRSGYKRFDLAVEAVRALPRLTLGIVGSNLTDAERVNLQKRLGSRWREFGPVSNKELRLLYSSVFAFIFPSDYEGFGLPILEAMACGCPVVAASLSSFPEVGGDVAIYANNQSADSYANAIDTLNTIDIRNTAVRNGLIRAAKFDWAATLQNTAALYAK